MRSTEYETRVAEYDRRNDRPAVFPDDGLTPERSRESAQVGTLNGLPVYDYRRLQTVLTRSDARFQPGDEFLTLDRRFKVESTGFPTGVPCVDCVGCPFEDDGGDCLGGCEQVNYIEI